MGSEVIDLVVVDMCALLLAPELRARLLLEHLDKDGIQVYCFADLERFRLRRALRARGLLQLLDGLLYEEMMFELTSAELRRLAGPSTCWLRLPEEVNYALLLKRLSPRRRLLPKVLRLVAQEDTP